MLRFFFLILVFASCSLTEEKAEVVIPKFPDPEHASMAGKWRILGCCSDSLSSPDTLIYDFYGRKVENRGYFSLGLGNLKIKYDTNNFIVRLLDLSDYPTNHAYHYEKSGDTVIQKIYEAKNYEFQITDFEYLNEEPKYIHYFIIQNQLITHKIDKKGFRVTYSYDSLNRLLQASRYDKSELIRTDYYEYIGSSKRLKTQVNLWRGDTVKLIRYDNGILSSIEEGFNHEFTFTLSYQDGEMDSSLLIPHLN